MLAGARGTGGCGCACSPGREGATLPRLHLPFGCGVPAVSGRKAALVCVTWRREEIQSMKWERAWYDDIVYVYNHRCVRRLELLKPIFVAQDGGRG